MAKTTTVRKDLIPYEAGVVVLTPLDENKRPQYEKSVATGYDFLTSTQTSVSHTTETLANGNGQDKDYVTDETYTLTVIGNTYNPVFHATVLNRIETLPEKHLMLTEATWNLPNTVADGTDLEITFGTSGNIAVVPAADEDGNVNFIVEDSYGNNLVRVDAASKLEKGTYFYDADSKALQFSEDYKGAMIRIIYSYEDANAIVYTNDPILKQPEYMVQVFGLSQSASTSDTYKVVTTLKRATASGDVTDQITQKSKSAPITYTFTSTPVPSGVSVYSQAFAPVTNGAGGDSGNVNVANGVDDAGIGKTQTGG